MFVHFRIDEDHSRVLRPLALVLIESRVTLLFPKENVDLYTALTEGIFMPSTDDNLRIRLAILRDVTEACRFCRARGLQLIDPRVSNVLVRQNYNQKCISF
jgi:hypothetical protein